MEQPLLPKPATAGSGKCSSLGSSKSVIILAMVVYLGSGISQPLMMSAVKLAGLGDTRCQIYMVPYYLGQACTFLVVMRDPPPRHKWKAWPLMNCVYIAMLGAIAQNMNYAGNMLAGSGIYAVIYSSVTIWAAILSRLILGRIMTRDQWLGIVAVFCGLAMNALGAKNEGSQVFLGIALVSVGAIALACTHVLSEFISTRGEKIPPQINSSVQGCAAVACVGGWSLFYAVPHWNRISGPATAASTSFLKAALLIFGIALGNFLHAAAFFHLLAHIGTTSTGVFKAVQAVVVFLLSHVLYCSDDPSQCLNQTKIASLLLVVFGILTYVIATNKAKPSKNKSDN